MKLNFINPAVHLGYSRKSLNIKAPTIRLTVTTQSNHTMSLTIEKMVLKP
jgi:hypothetical protein